MKKIKPVDKEFNKQVGIILKEARLRKGYTQQRVADLVDIPRTNYSQYEIGYASVPVKTFYQLCKVLDLDINTCLKDIPL